VAFVYCAFAAITLQGGLSNQTPCPAMETAFNNTVPNVYWKLNGTYPYTCFAITDPASGAPPTWNTNSLNYHLVKGLHPLTSLPIDGTLLTDNGDAIRITKFSNIYFVNGKVPLPTTYGEGYYDNGTVITNGIMYKFIAPLPLGTDYPALNVTTRKTIYSGLSDLSALVKSTLAMQYFQIGLNNLSPIPASMTLFVPSDAAFVGIPQYRLDYIMNTQAAAVSFLMTHAFSGTTFGYPLSLPNIPDFYTMTSLNGEVYNLTFIAYTATDVAWRIQPANKPDADQLNIVDGLRADGVVHSIPQFYLPPDWTWPKPSIAEFINQYDTFSQAIVTELIGFYFNGLSKFIADIRTSGIKIPGEVTVFLIRNNDYTTPNTDPSLIKYHFIPGQYLASELKLNEPIATTSDNESIRVVNYQDTLWVNGYSQITIPDIKLADATIHIIDFPMSLPAASDDPCVTCYKDVTILEDIATDPTLSSFYNFILNPPVELVSPYTIIVPSNVFSVDLGNIAKLNTYLSGNETALQEYIKNLLFDGLIFPAIALKDDEIPVLSISGFNYTVKYSDQENIVFITSDNTGSVPYPVRPRKDGNYIVIQEFLFNFPVPPPPPAPTPEPAAEKPPAVKPPDSAANYLSNLCLIPLIGFLVVLFLQ